MGRNYYHYIGKIWVRYKNIVQEFLHLLQACI